MPTVNLPFNPHGWFQTNPGESLTVTTGAGGTTAIAVVLAVQPGSVGFQNEMGVPLLLENNLPLLLESA